jgi:hypothetical protein
MSRYAVLAAAGALAAATALTTTGEHPSAAQEQTTCTFQMDITLSPGLSLQGGSGTFTTGGPKGSTLECTGPVNGRKPVGKGTISVDGRYGVAHPNGCDAALNGSGEGTGTDVLTIPTAEGSEQVTSSFSFTYGGKLPTHGGFVAGSFKGDHLSGDFELTPRDGTCVTPVTRVHVTGAGILH